MYAHLSDEDKLELAIKFVAVDQPLPKELIDFLKKNNLYELITIQESYNADARTELSTDYTGVSRSSG